MCGIGGVILPKHSGFSPSLMKSMSESLRHRGPDAHGFLGWNRENQPKLGQDVSALDNACIGLFHRRLTILDSSPAGWQPMVSRDRSYYIILNGEIYNYLELRRELQEIGYEFSSHSDTEVLLYGFIHWGVHFLKRITGMFAFAFLDINTQKIFLVRDFFGIKPLYYCNWNGGLAFSSEVQTLLMLPGLKRNVNSQRLYDYLRFGTTDHGGETLFAEISQVPAGCFVEVGLDSPSDPILERYWQVEVGEDPCLSFDQAAEQLRDLFLESVKVHLRSDYPVGAALSGGIDSSSIVMAMRHLGGGNLDIQALSYIAEDPLVNEELWIDSVGENSKARIHKIHLSPDNVLDELEKMIYLQGEPFVGTSVIAQNQVYKKASDVGLKVILDGQGADEFLGGYPIYVSARLGTLLNQGRYRDAISLLRRLPHTRGLSSWWALLGVGEYFLPDWLERPARKVLGEDLLPGWLDTNWFLDREVHCTRSRSIESPHVLRDLLHQTLSETSLPAFLRYADRNSMRFSVESRVPFLTPSLVSFVLSLPEEYIIAKDGSSKAVFKHAMRGIVPDIVLKRRNKVGFVTPERQWFTSISKYIDGALESGIIEDVCPLNRKELQNNWKKVQAGRKGLSPQIWRSVNLLKWTELFSVEY